MRLLKDQIEILKSTLSEKFGAKQIFIFGSYAYGQPDQESDIDICIVTDLKNKRKIEMLREIRRILIDLISNPMDILIYEEGEFTERAQLKSTLENKIINDGIRIYG